VSRAPYRLPCTLAARLSEAFPGEAAERLPPLFPALPSDASEPPTPDGPRPGYLDRACDRAERTADHAGDHREHADHLADR
jgi:hypothetical protein